MCLSCHIADAAYESEWDEVIRLAEQAKRDEETVEEGTD